MFIAAHCLRCAVMEGERWRRETGRGTGETETERAWEEGMEERKGGKRQGKYRKG